MNFSYNKAFSKIFKSKFIFFLLPILITFLFSPASAYAQDPKLIFPETSVKVKESFTIRVDNAPSESKILWEIDPLLKCKENGMELSCKLDNLKGEMVDVIVGAAIRAIDWTEKAVITIDKTGGRRIKTGEKPAPPLSPKAEKIMSLFDEYKTNRNEMEFFNKMGEGDIKISVKDLVSFKADIINQKIKETGDYKKAIKYWNDNFKSAEQSLMKTRRENIIKIWESVAKRYMSEHPDSPPIFRMDVGGWVTEPLEKMRFEGDIDFTVIMLDVEQAKIIRDMFESEVTKVFNMDMVSVDALATAHRAATYAVYIGDYGADWAEIDAIRRGKMYVIQRNEDGSLRSREANETEKAVAFAVLKNNIGMSRGEPDRLAEILTEKSTPEPKYDMEPGISLEFLRHITADAIDSNLAVHEKIIKMCKYLNRSAGEHNKIMRVANAPTISKDTAITNFASMITNLKQMKGINPEIALWLIMKRTGELVGDANWFVNPEEAVKEIAKRSTEVITHNINEGINARLMLAEKKLSPEEQDAEKLKLLNDLENEYRAFQGGDELVPFPEKAYNVMIKLTEYFNRKKSSLPIEEQRRLADLMKMMSDNPKAAKTWLAIAWVKISSMYSKIDQQIDAFNNFLDVLDNHTIEQLRSKKVLEFVRSKDNKWQINNPLPIPEINQALNESILGKIGNSTMYKGINLAVEGKAYWDAVMKAETWSEGFVNLGYELMSRRLPGYAATEALVMGSYGRLLIETAYLFCPLTAVPEGVYGMVKGTAEWGVEKYKKWQYDEMIDEIFKGAQFERDGKKWKISSLKYRCPSGDEIALSNKEQILNLPKTCPAVYHIIIPEIKNHPVLIQLQEMLSNESISSGQMGEFPYKYDTRGSKYGEELYNLYRKKVDDVVLEYFRGLVEKLEIAKGWASGTSYAEIIKIERELNCTKHLVEYSKSPSWSSYVLGPDKSTADIRNDAEKFQTIVNNFAQLKKSNAGIIKDIIDEWDIECIALEKADFKEEEDSDYYRWITEFMPECNAESIRKSAEKIQKKDSDLRTAVQNASSEAVKIVGEKNADKNTIRPLVKAGVCKEYYKGTKREKEYKEAYEEALNDLRNKSNLISIEDILIEPDTICEGSSIILTAKLDRECPECKSKWESPGYKTENITPIGNIKAEWVPKFTGQQTLRLTVRPFKDSEFEISKDKKINVLPAEKCPKLKLILKADHTEIQDNEYTIIKAEIDNNYTGKEKIKEFIWTIDGKREPKITEDTYKFYGRDRKGQEVKIGVRAKTDFGYTDTSYISIKVLQTTSKELSVSILPLEKDIINPEEPPVIFTADVIRKTDSGRMRYQWSLFVNGKEKPIKDKRNESSLIINGKDFSENDEIKIAVYVQDIDDNIKSKTFKQMLREGYAEKKLKISPSGELKIQLSEIPSSITDAENLVICVESPLSKPNEPYDKYTYEWFEKDDRFWRPNQTTKCSNVSAKGKTGTSIILKVIVRDKYGRKAEAETSPVKIIPAEKRLKLEVTVNPERDTITQEDIREIICTAKPFSDSGRLTFNNVPQKAGVNSITLKFSGKGHENLVPVVCEVKDEKGRTGEAVSQIFVKKKTKDEIKSDDKTVVKTGTEDMKSLADKKYKWLEQIPDYLEALIELDKKTHSSAEKEIRKTVLKKAASGAYPQCDNTCQKRVEEIRNSIGNCGPYVVKEKKPDPLTGEMVLINVIKEDKPCSAADQSRAEEAARLADPMSYEEFKCYEQISKPYREHQQELKRKLSEVKESKVLKNYQEYTQWSMFKEYVNEVETLKTKLNLPEPLPSPPVLPWTYSSSCGSAGSVTSEQTKLIITLKATKTNLKREEFTDVTAEVKGGKSPYSFEWKGNYSGKGKTVTFMSAKPGEHTLSVEVTDSAGSKGQASIILKVGGVTGIITGLSKEVVFGTWKQKVSVQAKTQDGKSISFISEKTKSSKKTGQYRVIWQSDPAISFYPSTSEDGKTDILFDRMGYKNKIKIWAEIQQLLSNGVYETAGETDQFEVSIVPPEFKWTFEPAKNKGRVGQEIKVTLTTEPKIKDELIYYFWDSPESSSRIPYSDNESVIGFVPKDTKPFNLLVQPKSKSNNDLIGGALSEQYLAAPYKVIITEPHYASSKPKLWKCDTQLGGAQKCGLVEVNDQFAVHHNIYMEALISPEIPKSDLRYKWSIQPDGICGFPGSGDQLTINCSSTGTFNITVQISDSKGIVLGSNSRSLNITISEKTLKESQKKIEDAEKSKSNLSKAFDLLHQGKIDEAINLAEDAAKSDPDSSPLKNFSEEVKKLGWDAVYERDFDSGLKLLKAAVKFAPKDNDAKEKLDKTNKFKKIWPQVEKKAKEFDNLIEEKKVVSAYKKILEIQDLQQEMPGQMANKFSQQLLIRWNRANEEYNKFIQESIKKHQEFYDAMDWDGMLAHVQEVLKIEHTPAEQKTWEGNLKFAKQKIAERNQAWQFYQSVKSIFEKGDSNQAYGMLNELKNKPQYFMKNDPKRQQIIDLITVLEKWHKVKSAKEYAINFFTAGDRFLKEYQYTQASDAYAEGLKAIRDNGDISDPIYAKYYNIYQDCLKKEKRLKELLPGVRNAAMDEKPLPVETIEVALRDAQEMVNIQPNNIDLQIFKSRLEQKLKNTRKTIENKSIADALWSEGDELYRKGNYSEALNKLKESLKLWSNSEREKYVKNLEKSLSKNKETAKKLRDEGEKLQNQNKLKEAITKYKESLTYWQDSALKEHITKIEEKIASEEFNKAKANELWEEGTDLFNQRQPSKALDKFRESIKYWTNNERTNYVKELDSRKAQAQKLRDQGAILQNQKKYSEAISKYRESIKYWPDPALEEHIAKIESLIKGTTITSTATVTETSQEDFDYVKGFGGKWNTNWGMLEFTIDGTKVYGNYTHDKGRIEATLSSDKKTMQGMWLEAPSYSPPRDGGRVTFTLSPDGNSITGKWGYGDSLSGGDWTGTRIKEKKDEVIKTPTENTRDLINLTGAWIAKCKGGDNYNVKITQNGSNFEAEVNVDKYNGTINGRKINGKSLDNVDTISGDIVSNNEIHVTLTGYIGTSSISNSCTIIRKK